MARRISLVALVLGLTWVIGLAPPLAERAYAQGQLAFATLTGQVIDQTGAAIPGASVSLQSKAGGQPLTTVSNEAGYYRIPFVRPGTYSLTVKKEAFSDVIISEIVLQVQQTANVDVTLQPGRVVQELTVSASSVALETQTSSLGGVVGEQINTQLPLVLRDPTQLVNLVPGVVADHRQTTPFDSSGTSYQGRLDFTINGGFRSQAVAMVDGVDITIKAGSFGSIPVQTTPDFIQEFKVQTNNLSAEFGGGAGVLNMVSKSGTNEIHGTAFEFLQNDNLNANDFFSNRGGAPKSEAKRNQFGFAVGGPIVKDKVFWFYNFERMDQRRALPVRTRVPSAAERTGNFSDIHTLATGALIPIYNPFDLFTNAQGNPERRPFLNNQIPSGMINSFASSVLSFYPSPNNPGLLGPGNTYTGVNNFQIAGSAPLKYTRFDTKIDYHFSPAHRFMWRYSYSNYRVVPLDVFNNPASSQSLSTRDNKQPGHNGVFSWTWTASPTLVIQQAGNWSRFTDGSDQPEFDPTSLGGPFASGAIANYLRRFTGGPAFPNISPGGYAPMGNGFGNNFDETFSNYQYSLGVSKIMGHHTLKSGFQFIVLQANDYLFKGFGGTYNFGGNWTCGPEPKNCQANTGNGLADMLLGLPTGGSMQAGFTSNYTSKYFAWYFQDDWRVTPKLTLNLGARYDFTTPLTERFDHIFRFDNERPNPLGSAIGPNTGGKTLDQYFIDLGSGPLMGAMVFPSSPGVEGRRMVPIDLTNLSPRVGFAWQVRPKLVVRGGISKLYMLSPVSPGPSTPGNDPFGALTNLVATTDGFVTPATTIDNPFPFGFNEPTYDRLGLMTLVGDRAWAGGMTNKTPYQWQWNFGVQYELSGNSLLSVAYAASRGHNLTCAFFFCGDQIPRHLVEQYGTTVFDTVPNPFYGIITNPRAPLSAATVQRGSLLRMWPAYTGWVPILPAWGGYRDDDFHNRFESLQVQFQKRYSQGLNLLVAYTWSKNITNTDSFEAGYLGPAIGYQDYINFENEQSLAADDLTHKLVIGHVYDLPFGKGKRFGANWPGVADKILGGWQLSGMWSFDNGFPLGIGITGHRTGAFGGGARPNLIGDPCLDPGRPRGEKIEQWLSPSGFAKPADLTFGNSSRTLRCRRDGTKNTDLVITKFIPVTERFKVEFRSEFYNAFNRPQMGGPDTTFLGGNFGKVFSQYKNARIIQFGLKLNF